MKKYSTVNTVHKWCKNLNSVMTILSIYRMLSLKKFVNEETRCYAGNGVVCIPKQGYILCLIMIDKFNCVFKCKDENIS